MWISIWVLLLVSSTRYPIGVMLISISSRQLLSLTVIFVHLKPFCWFIRLRVYHSYALNEVIFVFQMDNLAFGRCI